MRTYEEEVREQLILWERKILKKSSLMSRMSKAAQTKVNRFIPEKVHNLITESIKKMVQATLSGSHITTKKSLFNEVNLSEQDKRVTQKLASYRKTAVVEGAGTGAGGIFLGMADFPLLLSIKMKFLFETANIYGYDTERYEERLFLLHVFQLAFSSDEKRQETLDIIKNWDSKKRELLDMDWRVFQQEYRDHIDLAKLFQLLPGVGAVVGAYANYNLLDQLGETAMNAYRMRLLT